MNMKSLKNQINKTVGVTKLLNKFDHFDHILEDKERISIDIGAYSVKAVHVKIAPSGPILANVSYREIHEEGTKVSQDADDVLANALNGLLHDFKVKTKDVRVVLSDSNIYSRHITIPKISQDELSKSIKWQAEKYTPFPIDDAIVDYQNLALNSNLDENQMEVVIVAIERKVMNRYLSAMKKAKIVPSVIDFSPFASAKVLIKNYSFDEDEIVPIIDIGAKRSSITIINGPDLQLVRTIDVGGFHVTQALANGLGMSLSDAEKLKREEEFKASVQAEEADKFSYTIKPVLDELLEDLKRSFAYIEREFLSQKIQQVMICGGGAQLKGLNEYFSSAIGLPFKPVDGFQGLSTKLNLEEEPNSKLAALLLPAIGEAV